MKLKKKPSYQQKLDSQNQLENTAKTTQILSPQHSQTHQLVEKKQYSEFFHSNYQTPGTEQVHSSYECSLESQHSFHNNSSDMEDQYNQPYHQEQFQQITQQQQQLHVQQQQFETLQNSYNITQNNASEQQDETDYTQFMEVLGEGEGQEQGFNLENNMNTCNNQVQNKFGAFYCIKDQLMISDFVEIVKIQKNLKMAHDFLSRNCFKVIKENEGVLKETGMCNQFIKDFEQQSKTQFQIFEEFIQSLADQINPISFSICHFKGISFYLFLDYFYWSNVIWKMVCELKVSDLEAEVIKLESQKYIKFQTNQTAQQSMSFSNQQLLKSSTKYNYQQKEILDQDVQQKIMEKKEQLKLLKKLINSKWQFIRGKYLIFQKNRKIIKGKIQNQNKPQEEEQYQQQKEEEKQEQEQEQEQEENRENEPVGNYIQQGQQEEAEEGNIQFEQEEANYNQINNVQILNYQILKSEQLDSPRNNIGIFQKASEFQIQRDQQYFLSEKIQSEKLDKKEKLIEENCIQKQQNEDQNIFSDFKPSSYAKLICSRENPNIIKINNTDGQFQVANRQFRKYRGKYRAKVQGLEGNNDFQNIQHM